MDNTVGGGDSESTGSGGWSDSDSSVLGSIVSILEEGFKSVVDGLKDGLKELFIPKDGFFDEYLGPIYSVKDSVLSYLDIVKSAYSTLTTELSKDYSDDVPTYNVTLYGSTFDVLNLHYIKDYRPYIHVFITAIVWMDFFLWLPKRLKSIVYT